MLARALALAALLTTLLPAGALAAGELDVPFGTRGRALSPDALADRALDVERLPAAGRFLVLGAGGIVGAFRDDGRPDRRFGRRGRAWAGFGDGNASGVSLFASGGGVVVAGGQGLNALGASRLSASGRLVPSYGEGGHGMTLIVEDGFMTPSVNALGDASGRVVLGGVRDDPYAVVRREIELIRLRGDGRRDPTFGRDGIVRLPIADTAAAPSVALGGTVDAPVAVVAGDRYGRTSAAGLIVRFDSRGLPVSSAPHDVLTSALLSDHAGSVLLTDGPAVRVVDAFGVLSTTFGGRGVARVPSARTLTAAGIDRDGFVLAGLRREHGRNRLVVARLLRSGLVDEEFGRRGARTVDFPRVRLDQQIGALDADAYPRRLLAAAAVGDLLTDVREDLGSTSLGAVRLRLEDPMLDLATTRAVVDRTGRLRLRLRCETGPSPCGGISVVVRSGVVLARRTTRDLAGGRFRTLTVPTGRRGAALARRHRAVEVEVRTAPRLYDPDAVVRRVALRPAR